MLIDDYAENPQLALIDAATNPAFLAVLDEADFEKVSVDNGDDTQREVLALKKESIGKAVGRLIDAAKKANVDMKAWICGKDRFDLCARLDTPQGDLMRQLDSLIRRSLTQSVLSTLSVANVFAFFALPGAAWTFIGIFSAVGTINGAFVNLCSCPKRERQ